MAGLARYARPIVLLDAALLLGGVLLTSMNMLLIGWSVYIAGHVLAIVAFLAIGAYHRHQMDGWTWAALLLVEAGFILTIPQAVAILSNYIQSPTGATMLLPAQMAPIGHFGELLLWLGVALYGLAARRAKALPTGVGWILLTASVLGLLAAFADVWFITAYWWVLAMLMLVFALVGIGGSMSHPPRLIASRPPT